MIDETIKKKYQLLEQQMYNLKEQISKLEEIHDNLEDSMEDTITLNDNIIEKGKLDVIGKKYVSINRELNDVIFKVRSYINS